MLDILKRFHEEEETDSLDEEGLLIQYFSILRGQPETVLEVFLHSLEQTCSPAYGHMGGLLFGLRLIDDVIYLLYLGGAALICLLYDMQKLIQTAKRELKSEKLHKPKRAN